MTADVRRHSLRSASGRTRRESPSPLALAVVLLLAPTLAGCGVKVFGWQPIAPRPSAALPHAEGSSLDKQVAEAREQAALSPEEPYWPFRIGQLYAGADSSSRAEAELKAALARNPNYPPALSLLSRLYYDAERHEEAVRLLEAARARPEAFPGGVPQPLLAGLALHYDAMDRPDLAHQILTAMTRPDVRDAGPALVYLKLRGDKPESAGELAAATVAEDSKSAANQNNFGITRLRAGDPEAARRAFLKAIDIDPSLPGPYYNLAILEKFYRLDDEAATRWFARYWERSQDDPDGLAGVMGDAKDLAGKRDER